MTNEISSEKRELSPTSSLESLGGVVGVMGLGGAALVAVGFVASRAHSNMLGISDIVIVSTQEYIYTGLRCVLAAGAALAAELLVHAWVVVLLAFVTLLPALLRRRLVKLLRVQEWPQSVARYASVNVFLTVCTVLVVVICASRFVSVDTPDSLLFAERSSARAQAQILARADVHSQQELQTEFGSSALFVALATVLLLRIAMRAARNHPTQNPRSATYLVISLSTAVFLALFVLPVWYGVQVAPSDYHVLAIDPCDGLSTQAAPDLPADTLAAHECMLLGRNESHWVIYVPSERALRLVSTAEASCFSLGARQNVFSMIVVSSGISRNDG